MSNRTVEGEEVVEWRDEVLSRAGACSLCGGVVIPLACVALVARERGGRVHFVACHHLYCRTRLRESLLLDAATSDYLN